MDVAELYLSMTRPSAVPVVGECMADGFVGQIQIERWSWNLMNDDEIKRAEKDEKAYNKHRDFLSTSTTADLQEEILKLNDKASRKKALDSFRESEKKLAASIGELRKKARAASDAKERADLDKQIDDLLKQQSDAQDAFDKDARLADENLRHAIDKLYNENAKDIDRRTADERKLAEDIEAVNERIAEREQRNKSYEFNFSKRVDFATTQLLNSMKAGDVFPLAVLTINQRSSNSGMVLVFTVTNLRLLDYSLRAEVSETMTDMKEQWKAEFRSLAYVYKNRKAIESSSDGAEAATKLATQGTVRTFAMKKDLGI